MGLFAFKRARAMAAQRLEEQAVVASSPTRLVEESETPSPTAEKAADLGTPEPAAPQPRTSRRRTTEEPTAS